MRRGNPMFVTRKASFACERVLSVRYDALLRLCRALCGCFRTLFGGFRAFFATSRAFVPVAETIEAG